MEINKENSGQITRDYFDSLLLETRHIDAMMPSTEMELFGKTFDTPIMTGALSHLNRPGQENMTEMAKGAAAANAVMWCGMGSEQELEKMIATGASVIKITKPQKDNEEVIRRIQHAGKAGAFAVGIDIDHGFNRKGEYDSFDGQDFRPKSLEEIKRYVAATNLPFIIKGVLSVADAKKAVEAGASGIVISHHNGRIDYAIPPVMVLEEIVKEVGNQVKIFVDCSITSGIDVYKAMALGADACSIGRPLKREVDQGGAEAVAKAIEKYTMELKHTMAMTGVKDLASMDASVIHHRTFM